VDSILGNFNGILYEKLLIVGEESLWGGSKREGTSLKQLITDDKMEISFKFKEPFQAKNYLRFIFLTNAVWSAPNDIDDRRFFVLEASNRYKKDMTFFKAMWEDMNNGGYEDLMFILKNRDISARDFQNTLPLTEAAVENIEQSLSSVATVLQEWVEYGITGEELRAEWGTERTKKLIYDIYCERATKLGIRIVRDALFGRELKRMIPSVQVRQDSDGNRTRYYVLPDQDKAHEEFEAYKRRR
jgi:phage/plasmid-associated DNA primase